MVKSDTGFANDLLIHNIGKIDFSVKESIDEKGLHNYLKVTGYLPHSQVISEQLGASLLLLLINNTPNANLILTGKIFEYLASRRPIICIAPEYGDAANIIAECKAGKVFGFDETEKLKAEIIHSYDRFRQNKLHSESEGIEKYDRRNLTGQMAQLLTGLTV